MLASNRSTFFESLAKLVRRIPSPLRLKRGPKRKVS
jgi:hypothetical protein